MSVPRTADIVIIGGGVIGASIAWHLAQHRSAKVVVIERNYICSGTTGQSGAIIRQHYSNDFTAVMARDSLAFFQNWADIVGGDCGFTNTGVLITAGATTEEGVRRNHQMHQSLGIVAELLDRRTLADLEPRLDVSNLTLAAWEPTAGVADPVLTSQGFAAAARRDGVSFFEGVAVEEIAHDGEHVTGVETSDGSIESPIVINCGNIWGAKLMEPLSVYMRLTASRHPMPALRRPSDFGSVHPVVLDLESQGYLIPRGDISLAGSLGTLPNDVSVNPDTYSRGVSEAEIVLRRQTAIDLMPSMARAVVQGGWAGIYDESPDAHPTLDEVDGWPGLYVALGFSGHGFKLSPEFGRLMALRVLGGRDAAPELHPFRYTRFAEGQPIGAAYSSSVIA